ncbi:hypothetical protein ABW20_dc0101628 [Dactylellina cionopaga]|nr:hypothetical protein ABW20_dc0101628 [Dactylellina cionopaga]
MRFSTIAAAIAVSASIVEGHGLVTKITGANGVVMPGLSVIKGTRRDCQTNQCGSQRDSSIIRGKDMDGGKATPLGRTQGGGPVIAAKMIANFMGTFENGTDNPNAATAVIDTGKNKKKGAAKKREAPLTFGQLVARTASDLWARAAGKKKAVANKAAVTETLPAALMAGMGAESGLPTCSDTGVITLTYHQINGDGAGPLVAKVDATSGGTLRDAFVEAKVVNNVPGDAGGNSKNVMTDFDVTVQMPPGMVCSGTVAGVSGVCIVRLKNPNANGPFGGSAAFVQSQKSVKRALEWNALKKRHFARGVADRS